MMQQVERVSDPERREAEVIHYRLSYMVQGVEHGPDGAIVLLHDLPSGAYSWSEVMPRIAATNRAVYAIDMLGFGQSDFPWPADTSNWGQADALEFLFEKLKLTNIVLVGHGFGGAVAQVLATRVARERVAALILIDTLCYTHSYAANWPLTNMEQRQNVDAPKQTSLENLIKDLRDTLPNGSTDPKRFANNLGDYVAPWNSELGREVLFMHIRQLIPSYINSVATDLHHLGRPVLVIWSEKDQQFPLSYAQRLHREIPESRLVIIPGAGHLILFDAPEAVGSALADFINNLP